MIYTVTITSQGQISIPIAIRRQLGLDTSKRALVSVTDKKITIEPVKDFLELGGSLKTNKKPLSNAELNDVVAATVAQEYVQKLKRT